MEYVNATVIKIIKLIKMDNIYKALAQFQAECPKITKSEEGYGYKYASLENVLDIINPILTKYGLIVYQPLEGKSVKTILVHIESGDVIESTIDIPQDVSIAKMTQFQVLGSGITYLRRYSLSSLLGLVSEDDNDASEEEIKKENYDRR